MLRARTAVALLVLAGLAGPVEPANPAPVGRLAQLPGRYACFIRGGGFGCPEGRGLTVAVAVTVSPDGRNVYAASEDGYLGGLAIFRRYVR